MSRRSLQLWIPEALTGSLHKPRRTLFLWQRGYGNRTVGIFLVELEGQLSLSWLLHLLSCVVLSF